MTALPSQKQSQMEQYLELLCEKNEQMNLTAIRDREEIRVRHFEDSLRLLDAGDFSGKRVLDIGSGAGFPGLVLAIAREDTQVTLLDATDKKVQFMRSVCETLGLSNVTCLHGRAEELAHDPLYRETFDVAVSRGVTALPALCELCLPFVRRNGWMLAMKSEIESFAEVPQFGGMMSLPYVYTLPGDIMHTVIRIQKKAPTPAVFPRKWAQIKKGSPKL